MHVNQISVFVENKRGSLAEVTGVLSAANIDIRAFSIADTTDFGILRIIVNDPIKAEKVLKEAGIAVTLTKVLAVKMHDVPGSMHVILESLYKNNISVEYAYAFISRKKENAYIILRVDDVDAVEAVLAKDGIETVSESEVFSL